MDNIVPIHRFTSATAREMALRSHEARRKRKQAIMNACNIPLQSPAGDGYVAARLALVRAQLARLDQMILEETDARSLDRLASAQARVARQEQEMSGRPLPGQRRPGKEKPAVLVAANPI